MSFAERLEIPLAPGARALFAVAVGLLAALGLGLLAIESSGLTGGARVAAFLAVSAAFWTLWWRARRAASLGFGAGAVCGLVAPPVTKGARGDGWELWLADAPPAPTRRTPRPPATETAFARTPARLLPGSVWLPGTLVLHFAERDSGRRHTRWLLGDEMPDALWRGLKARVRTGLG